MRLSADPSGEIDELVEQLESAYSPWQKVKVLAKAWRTVRKLQPDERFLVAKNVGLEGAEVFLDKLGDPYIGVPADDLLDIVRAADAQDFSRWKEVVGRLRRPEERQKFLREGLEEARKALLHEPHEAELTEGGFVESQRELAPPPPPANEILEPMESSVEEQQGSSAEIAETGDAPVHEATAEIDIEEEAEEEVRDIAPVVEESGPLGIKAPGEEVPETKFAKADDTTDNVPVASNASFSAALERLTASDTLLGRFRRFRGMTAEMRELEIENLERLLECFPEGWARRRALTQMLRAGIPEDFDDAMTLVGAQRSASCRIWCLAALVEGRDLDEDEKALLLSRDEAPLIKRRLESRLREST